MDMHKRDEVVLWLQTHPHAIHADPLDIVRRCERSVRHHAAAIAWRDAREYVRARRRLWEERWGYECFSDDFVAREICALLAHELQHRGPLLPDEVEDELAGEAVLADLEVPAWLHMRAWVRELALEEERATWRHVVRFTRKRGRALAREGRMPEAHVASERSYAGRAVSVVDLLMKDFDAMLESSLSPTAS